MLKKTSQFPGKAQPNTQHLNPSESFCWVSLGLEITALNLITTPGRTPEKKFSLW
jgi:hypothetical protein